MSRGHSNRAWMIVVLVLLGIAVTLLIGWPGRSGAPATNKPEKEQRATKGPERGARALDSRLLRMVKGEPTPFTAASFQKYLDSQGWRPGAVLACALLANQNGELVGKIRIENADAEVLRQLPLLNVSKNYQIDQAQVLARLRELGIEDGATAMIELRLKMQAKDPTEIRAAVARMAAQEPVDGDHYFAPVLAEMRAALAAVDVHGTEAEIAIDEAGLRADTYRHRAADAVNDAWKEMKKDRSLSAEERLATANDCLNALEDQHGWMGNSGNLAGQREILKSLPPGTQMDGVEVSVKIAALEERISAEDDHSKNVTEAFFRARPEVIDAFYGLLRENKKAEADALLLKKQ